MGVEGQRGNNYTTLVFAFWEHSSTIRILLPVAGAYSIILHNVKSIEGSKDAAVAELECENNP